MKGQAHRIPFSPSQARSLIKPFPFVVRSRDTSWKSRTFESVVQWRSVEPQKIRSVTMKGKEGERGRAGPGSRARERAARRTSFLKKQKKFHSPDSIASDPSRIAPSKAASVFSGNSLLAPTETERNAKVSSTSNFWGDEVDSFLVLFCFLTSMGPALW